MYEHTVTGWRWVAWLCLAVAGAVGLFVAFAIDVLVLAFRGALWASVWLWDALLARWPPPEGKDAPAPAPLSTGCWLCDAIGQPCARAGELGHPEPPPPPPLPLWQLGRPSNVEAAGDPARP